VLADSAGLARAAGLLGIIGAAAFLRFFVVACQRMRALPAAAEVPRD
jgi:hypothetical protein